jgi:hypothetical protein
MTNQDPNQATASSNRTFLIIFLIAFIGINIFLIASGVIHLNWKGFGIILGAGLTLSLYSFLYRDNPLYRFAEHLYVGIAAGYLFVILWYNTFWIKLFAPLFWPDVGKLPELTLIIPFIMGLLMVTRFFQKFGWLSRFPFAFIIGWGSGLTIVNVTTAIILRQSYNTVQPLIDFQGVHVPLDGSANEIWMFIRSFDQILIFIGVMCVFIYFFFSVEHRKGIFIAAQTGVAFLMIAFGASFGFTIMARLSLLIGRVRFLLFEWLQVNDWSVMVTEKVQPVIQTFHQSYLC